MSRRDLLSAFAFGFGGTNVMNWGDRREPLFHDEADRWRFVETLGEACAYVLMLNHFYLAVETPRLLPRLLLFDGLL